MKNSFALVSFVAVEARQVREHTSLRTCTPILWTCSCAFHIWITSPARLIFLCCIPVRCCSKAFICHANHRRNSIAASVKGNHTIMIEITSIGDRDYIYWKQGCRVWPVSKFGISYEIQFLCALIYPLSTLPNVFVNNASIYKQDTVICIRKKMARTVLFKLYHIQSSYSNLETVNFVLFVWDYSKYE